MCIAVCPVGALTDRHFGHHPWELDTTETICGFCDGGCTINVESNRGLVRRVTNLWERGVNHGYLCEKGKWGHEQVQSPDRLFYPIVRPASATDGSPTKRPGTMRSTIAGGDAAALPGRPVRGAGLSRRDQRRGLRRAAVHPRGHGQQQYRPPALTPASAPSARRPGAWPGRRRREYEQPCRSCSPM